MQKFQAQALSQMAEGVSEYNKGVLCALGHAKLYDEWSSALIGQRLALSRVEDAEAAATTDDSSMFSFPEIDPALRDGLNAQRARVAAAWRPIQALKDQAQDALDSADPFGMGQAA